MTDHLTQMFDKVAEQGWRETPSGMAHWKGTGPERTVCRMCQHYATDGRRYIAVGGRHAKGQLMPAWCRKYRMLAGRKGDKIPSETPSCKHFELNERFPQYIEKPKL